MYTLSERILGIGEASTGFSPSCVSDVRVETSYRRSLHIFSTSITIQNLASISSRVRRWVRNFYPVCRYIWTVSNVKLLLLETCQYICTHWSKISLDSRLLPHTTRSFQQEVSLSSSVVVQKSVLMDCISIWNLESILTVLPIRCALRVHLLLDAGALESHRQHWLYCPREF